MKRYRLFFVLTALSLLFSFNLSAAAQGRIPAGWYEIGTQFIPGQPDALFAAKLQDPMSINRTRAATVTVRVAGVSLVEPATTGGKAEKGQAHILYQLDSGPIVESAKTQQTFCNLSPGFHKIKVMLVGNDHKPLGPQETFGILLAEKPKDMVNDPKTVMDDLKD